MEWLVLLVVLGLPALAAIVLYNGLVSKRNRCENAFSGIDVQLKKRYDLIPNLVETVKGYASHESETLEAVMAARGKALAPGQTTDQQVEADNALGATLGRLMMLQENYPELKADSQFEMLQRSLNEVEAQLSASRRTFNAAVNEYNDACELFPSNLVANGFGFRRRAYFETREAEREPVRVSFSS